MEDRDVSPYDYVNSAKEPAKRVQKLNKALETIRPMLNATEVKQLQSDRLYANVDVTYRNYESGMFEVKAIEKL